MSYYVSVLSYLEFEMCDVNYGCDEMKYDYLVGCDITWHDFNLS